MRFNNFVGMFIISECEKPFKFKAAAATHVVYLNNKYFFFLQIPEEPKNTVLVGFTIDVRFFFSSKFYYFVVRQQLFDSLGPIEKCTGTFLYVAFYTRVGASYRSFLRFSM